MLWVGLDLFSGQSQAPFFTKKIFKLILRPHQFETGDRRAEKDQVSDEWQKLKVKMEATFKTEDRWKLLEALKTYHQVNKYSLQWEPRRQTCSHQFEGSFGTSLDGNFHDFGFTQNFDFFCLFWVEFGGSLK